MVCICSGVTPFLPICIWGSRWWAWALSSCRCLLVSVMVCVLVWVVYIGVYWWVLWGKIFSVGKNGRGCYLVLFAVVEFAFVPWFCWA